MRTHFRHGDCDGEIIAEIRTIETRPSDKGWPKNADVRVPICTTCRAVIPVTECRDERLPADIK